MTTPSFWVPTLAINFRGRESFGRVVGEGHPAKRVIVKEVILLLSLRYLLRRLHFLLGFSTLSDVDSII
jgi:hypothetical protein